MRTVGAYEAKTHLSELLDEVESGETVLITRHGKTIAMLAPSKPAAADPNDDLESLVERMRRLRGKLNATREEAMEWLREGRS